MVKSMCHPGHTEPQAAEMLIPFIRAAATIGFAVAPCSLGFVIIAVSEQLIRAILVGDDPELLVSELQNQFPHAAIEAAEQDEGLMAEVVQYIDRSEQVPNLPFESNGSIGIAARALNVLQETPANP